VCTAATTEYSIISGMRLPVPLQINQPSNSTTDGECAERAAKLQPTRWVLGIG
jgi:hypothetical protein